MTPYVALLRGVNVGGVTLKMNDLKRIADELGLSNARTYVASGNLVFVSRSGARTLKAALEERIAKHMGRTIPILIRTAAQMEAIARANPFPEVTGNRVQIFFLDAPVPDDLHASARNIGDERIAVGDQEVYVAYGESGIGRSRLRIPAAEAGTARNMNTVARLAEIARELQ